MEGQKKRICEEGGKSRSLWRIFACLMTALVVLISATFSFFPRPAAAKISSETLKDFARSDSVFYDPSGADCDDVSFSGSSDGSDVYMIGDSITVISGEKLKAELPDITINAQSSIWFSKTEPGLTSGVDRIPEMGDQPILVFALGTNGGVVQSDIDKLFEALKGKNLKIILMTIYYRDPASKEQMESTNALIESVAEQYENVSYFDWNAVATANPIEYLDDDGIHPSEVGARKFAETVKAAVDIVSEIGVGANAGDGDFSAIMSAKNADQNVPYVNYNSPARLDGWSASWNDNDEDSMANLLEKYGDLAYQLGKAVGAPYVAILVQMRYEDPNSVCGDNNFWGNGCPPGTKPGQASLKARNLGEGFVNYAKTLTNGAHDQALGVADPKEFLDKIGPTWIHGDPNAAGYSDIAAMKSSVDALTKFIESARGRSIVEDFLNYSGTYAGGVICPTDEFAANGVTTLDIDGVTYAFPIAYATKDNYLKAPGHNSELSTPHAWDHHDYPAVDLGIDYNKMVRGRDFSLSDYPQWSSTHRTLGSCGLGSLQDCEASTGAPVVAFTDGIITNYKTYSRAEPASDQPICASVYLQSTVGDKDLYYNIHLGYEPEFVSMIGKQVKAGDVIGHVGLESCAQGTQAHLHFQTSDKSAKIRPIIDRLYEALPADAAELAEREMNNVGEDGLTLEQAKQFMKNYGANKNGSSAAATGSLWNSCNGGGSNCVTFSAFFLTKFANKRLGMYGNGYQVVDTLAAAGVPTGSEPRVWSVFSWSNGGLGHTGVILGHHDGKWIVGHASCSNLGQGAGDGTLNGGGSGFVMESTDIREATYGGYRDLKFAYFDRQVSPSAIAKYITTGE